MTPDFWTEPSVKNRLRYACCGMVVIAAFALGVTQLPSQPDRMVASDVDTAILVDLAPERTSSAPKVDPTEVIVTKEAAPPAPENPINPALDPDPKTLVPPEAKPETVLPPDALPTVPDTSRQPPAPIRQVGTVAAQSVVSETPTPEAPPIESEAARSARARAISRWQNALVIRIEAAKHGAVTHETGTVELAFALGRDGRLGRRAISKSSGSRVLDDLALRLLEAAAPFPPPPAAMNDAMLTFRIPIRFNPLH